MKIFKRFLLLIIVIMALAGYGRHLWFWYSNPDYRAAHERLKIVGFCTNGVHGIAVEDRETGRPVYVEFDFSHQGKPDEISFFFHGTNIFNVDLETNRPPIYETIFCKNGKKHVTWRNRGASEVFTDRVFWDETGDKILSREVWYQQAWHQLTTGPDGRGGLLVQGLWHALRFSNDEWIIKEEQSQALKSGERTRSALEK